MLLTFAGGLQLCPQNYPTWTNTAACLYTCSYNGTLYIYNQITLLDQFRTLQTEHINSSAVEYWV